MAKRGRGARIKGAAFENKLAKILTDATKFEWRRGLGQTRLGGREVPDVHSLSIPWMHIEAKRHKACSIKAAMVQAMNDVEESGKMPVVITKDDRKPILVTMLMDDWIELLNARLDQKK